MDGPGYQRQPRAGARGPVNAHARERSYGAPRNTPRSPSATPGAMAVGDSTGLLGTKPAQQNIALSRVAVGLPTLCPTAPGAAGPARRTKRGQPRRRRRPFRRTTWKTRPRWRGGLCGAYRALPSPTAEHRPFLSGRNVRSPRKVRRAPHRSKRAMFASVGEESALKSVSRAPTTAVPRSAGAYRLCVAGAPCQPTMGMT